MRIRDIYRYFIRQMSAQLPSAQPIDVESPDPVPPVPQAEVKMPDGTPIRKRMRTDADIIVVPTEQKVPQPKIPAGLNVSLLQDWLIQWLTYATQKDWNVFVLSAMMTNVVIFKGKQSRRTEKEEKK